MSSCPNTIRWKEYSFLIELHWQLCWKLIIYVWSGLYSVPLTYVCNRLVKLFWLYSKPWNSGTTSFSTLFFCFQNCFWLFYGEKHFDTDFKISLPISTKMASGIVIEIVLNLSISLKRIDILTVFSLAVYDLVYCPFYFSL